MYDPDVGCSRAASECRKESITMKVKETDASSSGVFAAPADPAAPKESYSKIAAEVLKKAHRERGVKVPDLADFRGMALSSLMANHIGTPGFAPFCRAMMAQSVASLNRLQESSDSLSGSGLGALGLHQTMVQLKSDISNYRSMLDQMIEKTAAKLLDHPHAKHRPRR